jgi:EAL domain-containing protein (putative c-di-GMP-specific phosphodiesterase class I)/GGDEF domain-containing protein/integral membrane sensor domain MASE1
MLRAMTLSAAAPPRAFSQRAALTTLYLAVSTLAFVLVSGHTTAGGGLWFPPAGIAFGYLLVAGWRSWWAVLLARTVGGLLTVPGEYAARPALSLAVDTATTFALVLGAEWLRRTARPESAYALLTRFLAFGVVLAPVAEATSAALLALASGHQLDRAAWARAVVGSSAAIATLAPAFALLAKPRLAQLVLVRAVPARRRWELAAQAVLILLLPAMSVLTGGAGLREVVLLPIALVPLAWTAADADRARGAAVLAVAALVLGAAAELRFGDSETTFRLQLLMFAGALAALFATAGVLSDARARQGAELESTRWRALVEAAPVAVARVGADGRWRPEPGTGSDADGAAADVITRAARVPAVVAAVTARAPASVEWGVDDDTGRRFVTRVTPLPDGDVLAVTAETTRLHSAEVQLAWERSHDRETDLPNRDLLLATAEQMLAERRPASLVLLDIDDATSRAVLLDIDPVRVLLVTADRVRDLLDPHAVASGAALVARVGSDQFGVLVPDDVAAARERAGRMVRAIRAPLPGSGAVLTLGAWAGVAPLDADRGAKASLQRAEAALQAAAERGRERVVVLDNLSVRTSAQRARLTGDVASAVGRGELEVAFQPDVTLHDGRLSGVEALVRWRRRRGFATATDTFVQLAEEIGAVQAVDAWVMEESLRALGEWRARFGAEELELGLNVSALSLDPDLPDRLVDACGRNGVPPQAVRLEVTETALGKEGVVHDVLGEVRERGCQVALDDFGTGYATLARLHLLPIDVLKLDRSFLPSITIDEQGRALVSLVLGLAELLHMDVVAEGVESWAQRQVLVDLGCRRAQGYLYSRPASPASIAALLAAGGFLPAVHEHRDAEPSQQLPLALGASLG